jgi:two-component system response regulator RpaA
MDANRSPHSLEVSMNPPGDDVPFALIADDDPVSRRIVQAILENAGFATGFAANGEEVQAAVVKRKPRVVVLDLMMPVQDGFTTLIKLRTDARMADVAVVMLTARSNDNDERRCRAAGAADFLVKPFDPDRLASRVRELATPRHV